MFRPDLLGEPLVRRWRYAGMVTLRSVFESRTNRTNSVRGPTGGGNKTSLSSTGYMGDVAKGVYVVMGQFVLMRSVPAVTTNDSCTSVRIVSVRDLQHAARFEHVRQVFY